MFFVSCNVSAGPSKQSSVSENPTARSAWWKISRADWNLSARLLPIPTNCEPCPGKTNAVFIKNEHFQCSLFPRALFSILWSTTCVLSIEQGGGMNIQTRPQDRPPVSFEAKAFVYCPICTHTVEGTV